MSSAEAALHSSCSVNTVNTKHPSITRTWIGVSMLNPAASNQMQYGNAVEKLVADQLRLSPQANQFLRYAGGPNKPDFIGLGAYAGQQFDITTALQAGSHLARPYGPGLGIITYGRQITFGQ